MRGSSSSVDGPIIEEDGGDSKILKSLESIKQNMVAGLSRINDDIEALKCELKSDIKSRVSEELNEATKSLTAAQLGRGRQNESKESVSARAIRQRHRGKCQLKEGL